MISQQVQERLALYELDTCTSGVVDGFQEHGAGVDLKLSLRCFSPSPARNPLFQPSPLHGGHIMGLFPAAEPSPPKGCAASRQKALMARQALLAACRSELTDGTELRTLALADLMHAGAGELAFVHNLCPCQPCFRSRSRSGSILPSDWLVPPAEGELQINGDGDALDEFEEQYTLGTRHGAASGSVSKPFTPASRCVVATQTLCFANIALTSTASNSARAHAAGDICTTASMAWKEQGPDTGCAHMHTSTHTARSRAWSTPFGTHSRTMTCARKCL